MVKEDIFAKIVLDSPNDKDEFCNHIISNLYLKYDDQHVTDELNYEVVDALFNAIIENINKEMYLDELYLFVLKYSFFFYNFNYSKNILMRYIFKCDNNSIFHRYLDKKFNSDGYEKDILYKKLLGMYITKLKDELYN